MGDRRVDIGALIAGVIIIGVGTWFLLRNTFGINLPNLDWEMIWPILVLAVGVIVIVNGVTGRAHRP